MDKHEPRSETAAEIVAKAVMEAGGQTAVARHFDLHQPTVFKWTRKGLPRTEWTGETAYAVGICALANANPERTRLWSSEHLLVRDGIPAERVPA